MKAEVRINLLQWCWQKQTFNLLDHLVELEKFLLNCIYCTSDEVIEFAYFCI